MPHTVGMSMFSLAVCRMEDQIKGNNSGCVRRELLWYEGMWKVDVSQGQMEGLEGQMCKSDGVRERE